jgi:hypothetical protein
MYVSKFYQVSPVTIPPMLHIHISSIHHRQYTGITVIALFYTVPLPDPPFYFGFIY